ncbi:MAG: hypothetical protein U1E65_36535 [Myxococcota bacterium]
MTVTGGCGPGDTTCVVRVPADVEIAVFQPALRPETVVGCTLTATQAATTHARSDADGGFMLALPPGSASFVATDPFWMCPTTFDTAVPSAGIVELKVEFNHGAM